MFEDIIKRQRHESFRPDAHVSDEECLGVAIAHFYKWDVVSIVEVCQAALEDANAHSLNRAIDAWKIGQGWEG